MELNYLSKLQRHFVQHMLDQSSDIESFIVDSGKIDSHRRLSIYRNGYRIRLKATIETDHPVLGVFLGDQLFDQMFDGYIDSHPSRYPSLRQFAENLPDFLSRQKPYSEHPVIAELAEFERRLIYSFDAADAPRYSLSDLEKIPPDHWPNITLTLHPSVQTVSFRWNTIDIWQALKAEQVPTGAMEDSATWLIWRGHSRLTEFRSLNIYESQLLELAVSGADFSELCDSLLEFFDEQQTLTTIVQFIQQWLKEGLVMRIKI